MELKKQNSKSIVLYHFSFFFVQISKFCYKTFDLELTLRMKIFKTKKNHKFPFFLNNGRSHLLTKRDHACPSPYDHR